MKRTLALVRIFAVRAALALAALIAAAPHAAAQRDNFWLKLAVDQAVADMGPGPIASAIDYAALRLAMEAKPEVIRARIAACGSCKERATLERELVIAERDRQVIGALESFIAREVYNVQPWEGWKLGLKVRPDEVTKGPAACIPLYDRYMNCAVPLDDRSAGEFGRACYAEDRLHKLCAAGKAKPFYDYVAFLNRRVRGDPVSETEGWVTMYYNVGPDVAFPKTPIDPKMPYFTAVTDSKAAGALRSAAVSGMSGIGPGLDFSNGDDFRKPWDAIVRQDNAAVSKSARILECRYVQAGTNLLKSFLFWYRERPVGADPKYLSGRMPDHPLLRVGAPMGTCPATLAKAQAVHPIVPTATLKTRYGEKLKQAGDPDGVRVPTPEEVKQREDAAAARQRARGQ